MSRLMILFIAILSFVWMASPSRAAWSNDSSENTPICNEDGYQRAPVVIADDAGGFIVAWASGKNIKDRTSSYIQRISVDGRLLWGKDGIKLD